MQYKMKRIVVCFLCMLLLCGCAKDFNIKDDEKLSVVTTIFPLYDFARAVGGDNVEVKMLIKPGSEVHSYDPLPSDMVAVCNSDLFLYIGGESDKWVDTLLDDENIKSLPLINSVEQKHEEHDSNKLHHNHSDEHIWTAPKNAVLMIKSICQSFAEVDSKNAAVYQKNCNEYIKKITAASKKIETTVSKCKNPFILVADRFPFGFFAKQYGIEYAAAFDGCAVSTDISLKTMSRLTKTIKEKNIKTVFCTELSNKSIANALSGELGVEILELHSAHNVSAKDFTGGITYVDILYRNNEALERGLLS